MPSPAYSRAQVFHDKSGVMKTAGGLTYKDLVQLPDGRIVSKAKAGKVPPGLAARAAAQQQVLAKKGIVGGQGIPFEKFIVKKGSAADKQIKRLAKKMLK
jgi:hypothetical protein